MHVCACVWASVVNISIGDGEEGADFARTRKTPRRRWTHTREWGGGK